jgi:uncharacterized protein
MEAIYIPQLTKAPEKTEVVPIQEFIPELETLTPVRGQMKIQHQGNYLEVSGKAETIVTLTCHRCLNQYNHRLIVDTSEMIWLDESASLPYEGAIDKEVVVEDLVESLPPQGYFNPIEWLYEQLCLEMPQKQLCQSDCKGLAANNSNTENLSDRRWASLEALKKQIP